MLMNPENGTSAWIAMGSNMGDREGIISACVNALNAQPGIAVVSISSFYDTAPVGGPENQPTYLNAAAELRTRLSARELLQVLLDVERAHGRVRDPKERNGPRTADLDLLLYGDEVIDEPGLQVPHPRMHERRFVLDPLNEIAGQVVHPVLKKRVMDLRG
jgi:2-amino-4-hydroxy-6-hydroxymethyldihydropteridine diphosphokinase